MRLAPVRSRIKADSLAFISPCEEIMTRTYSVRTSSGTTGDGAKMYNEGRVLSLIVHLRPQAPPQMGTPALPRPRCVPTRFCFGYINAQFDRACLNTMKTLLKKSNENSERVLFEYAVSLSETELRAAQPNLHRGRAFAHVCKSRREPATSQARRNIK